MNDYILLMHSDATDGGDWDSYLFALRMSGCFEGGSAIGDGACFRKDGEQRPVSEHIGGYIKVQAASLEDAKRFLIGNPVYEAGGTVEIRELPRE